MGMSEADREMLHKVTAAAEVAYHRARMAKV